MKNLLLIALSVMLFAGCTDSEDDKPYIPELALYSTTFKSEVILTLVEVPGSADKRAEERYRVMKFRKDGKMEYFQVDKNNSVVGSKVTGTYMLNFPKISQISEGSTEKETVVLEQAGVYAFFLDGMRWVADGAL